MKEREKYLKEGIFPSIHFRSIWRKNKEKNQGADRRPGKQWTRSQCLSKKFPKSQGRKISQYWPQRIT